MIKRTLICISMAFFSTVLAAEDYSRNDSYWKWNVVNKQEKTTAGDETCRLYTRERVMQDAYWLYRNTKGEKLVIERDMTGKCVITAGNWRDFYTGEAIESPSDVDVDHVLSVKDAWESGLRSHREREEGWTRFYNDRSNLVVTHKSVNRSKGTHDLTHMGEGNWDVDDDDSTLCLYVEKYGKTKEKYGLTWSEDQAEEYLEHADACVLPMTYDQGVIFSDYYFVGTIRK